MKFSVVIPAHNEVESVGLTVESCVEELEAAAIDYEIVVVDDASGDGTGEVVLAISERNPRVRCLRSTLPPASATPSGPGWKRSPATRWRS